MKDLNLKFTYLEIMKILLKAESLSPYIAIILFFLSIKLALSGSIYLIIAIILGLYFFPGKLLINNFKYEKSTILSSLLFSNILVFTALFHINYEMRFIGIILGILGLLCMVLIVYSFIFEKLKVSQFFQLIGFGILSGLYLII